MFARVREIEVKERSWYFDSRYWILPRFLKVVASWEESRKRWLELWESHFIIREWMLIRVGLSFLSFIREARIMLRDYGVKFSMFL